KIHDTLKLKGIMLKDVEVLRSIDEDIENSQVLNCSLKKNGDFKANAKSIFDKKNIDLLLAHMEEIVKGIGEEIFEGHIHIKPIKSKKGDACTYCSYKSICFFDPFFKENKFDYKFPLKDDEILERLAQRGEKDEVDGEST